MKSKQEFGLTQQKQSLSLFKTGKKQLVKSNLILKIESTTKKVTKEVFWGQHMDSKVLWRKKKHQINT
jgi:hypothetical protein